MARKIVNNALPNFSVIDSPHELRELMRKSSSLVFLPTLALQRAIVEDKFKANGYMVHRLDDPVSTIQMPTTPLHPGRVLTCYITNCTGFTIPATEVQHVIFWGVQPIDHLAQGRARVRSVDNGTLLTGPVPGYIYMGVQ